MGTANHLDTRIWTTLAAVVIPKMPFHRRRRRTRSLAEAWGGGGTRASSTDLESGVTPVLALAGGPLPGTARQPRSESWAAALASATRRSILPPARQWAPGELSAATGRASTGSAATSHIVSAYRPAGPRASSPRFTGLDVPVLVGTLETYRRVSVVLRGVRALPSMPLGDARLKALGDLKFYVGVLKDTVLPEAFPWRLKRLNRALAGDLGHCWESLGSDSSESITSLERARTKGEKTLEDAFDLLYACWRK